MSNTNIESKELATTRSGLFKVILDMSKLHEYELPLTSQPYIDGRRCQYGLTNSDGETVHLLENYDHRKYYDHAIFYRQSLESIYVLVSDIDRSFGLTEESSGILAEKWFGSDGILTRYLNIYTVLCIDPDEKNTFRINLAIGDAQDAYTISTFYSRY